MKKLYFSLLLSLGVVMVMAAPTIFTPELVAPTNNQTGVAPNVTLDWAAVVGQPGLHYEVQLSTDAEFTAPENFSVDLSRISMANLMFGDTYFWRVRAVDPTGISDWTEIRSFTVVTRTILRGPNNGATVDANVELKWDEITGVSFYDYQLDTTDTFDSPELRTITIPGNLKKVNAANLEFGTTYFVRIRARHSLDTSAWTNPSSFTVTTTFTLREPANNAEKIAPLADVRWTKVNGINKYNIYVSTDPDMHSYDIYTANKADTRKKLDTLLFGTTYYWQMGAIHSTDTLFSAIWSFTTMSAITNVSPTNNATNVPLQTILKWNTVPGIIAYQVQIANNPDFNNANTYPIHDLSNISTQSFKVPLAIMDSATTYYWRTKMLSLRDTSDWSPAWSFRTVALGTNEIDFVRNVKVYPSPATSSVNIQLPATENGNAELIIFDLLGKARLNSQVTVNRGLIRDIPVENLPEGLYLFQILKQGKSYSNRLIISR